MNFIQYWMPFRNWKKRIKSLNGLTLRLRSVWQFEGFEGFEVPIAIGIEGFEKFEKFEGFGCHRITSEWPLIDHLMIVVWPLNDYCMTIEWQSNDHRKTLLFLIPDKTIFTLEIFFLRLLNSLNYEYTLPPIDYISEVKESRSFYWYRAVYCNHVCCS